MKNMNYCSFLTVKVQGLKILLPTPGFFLQNMMSTLPFVKVESFAKIFWPLNAQKIAIRKCSLLLQIIFAD
jgi:hypothetical protein